MPDQKAIYLRVGAAEAIALKRAAARRGLTLTAWATRALVEHAAREVDSGDDDEATAEHKAEIARLSAAALRVDDPRGPR